MFSWKNVSLLDTKMSEIHRDQKNKLHSLRFNNHIFSLSVFRDGFVWKNVAFVIEESRNYKNWDPVCFALICSLWIQQGFISVSI